MSWSILTVPIFRSWCSLTSLPPVASPVITTQPTSQQNVVPGTTVTFVVQATGGGLTYLWKRNGETLGDDTKYSGTTTANLTVMNVVEEDEGNFTCVVTNVVGSVTSSAAELTVCKWLTVCACFWECSCQGGWQGVCPLHFVSMKTRPLFFFCNSSLEALVCVWYTVQSTTYQAELHST